MFTLKQIEELVKTNGDCWTVHIDTTLYVCPIRKVTADEFALAVYKYEMSLKGEK